MRWDADMCTGRGACIFHGEHQDGGELYAERKIRSLITGF